MGKDIEHFISVYSDGTLRVVTPNSELERFFFQIVDNIIANRIAGLAIVAVTTDGRAQSFVTNDHMAKVASEVLRGGNYYDR